MLYTDAQQTANLIHAVPVQHNDVRNSASAVLLESIRALDTVSTRFRILASHMRADHIAEHRQGHNVPAEQTL